VLSTFDTFGSVGCSELTGSNAYEPCTVVIEIGEEKKTPFDLI